MQRMVNDLLQLSRIGRAEPEWEVLDLQAPLEEAMANLGTAIEESEAVVEFGELDRVEADHGRIVQLFQNLLSNAIKYHGEGPPRIRVNSESDPEDDEMVRVAVSDNGRGMEPEQTERIFLPFQRLQSRKADSGSGIGLSICRRIAERHGGRIWAASEPGEGSTFYFTLPKEG